VRAMRPKSGIERAASSRALCEQVGDHAPVPHGLDPWFATPQRAVSRTTFERTARVMKDFLRLASGAVPSPPPVWLGEFALACFGGRAKVSEAWAGTLFYLETLGQAATQGIVLAARQDLTGAGYGLIDRETLEPRPDFWALALWKRFMGCRVLGLSITTARAGQPTAAADKLVIEATLSETTEAAIESVPAGLRAYAHCLPTPSALPQTASVLLLNVDSREARVRVRGAVNTTRAYLASAQNGSEPLADTSGVVRLGGTRLGVTASGELPFDGEALAGFGLPLSGGDAVLLPQFTYAFVSPVLSDACS
jgi:hypothetical protein